MYKMIIETKGGSTYRTFKRIIFTCNHHPKEWFPMASEVHQAALMRRFNVVKEMNDINEYFPKGGSIVDSLELIMNDDFEAVYEPMIVDDNVIVLD